MNRNAVDLRLMRSFVAVARTGSVTRAAAELHLTQPALSQHLREMGELMGVPLFDRVGRGVMLTRAGADLYAQLDPLLSKLDLVLTDAIDSSRDVRGSLRIGAIDTYARSLVIPAVSALLAAHSQLRVSVREVPAAAIDRELVENELDIGVAFSHLSSPDIEQRTLFREQLGLARVASAHAGRRPVSLAEVATHPLALLNGDFAMRRQIDTAFARADIALDVRVEAANVDSLMRLAEAGRYATIASRLALPRNTPLVMVDIADDGMARIAALRWRKGKTFSPAMESFEQALMAEIRAAKLDLGHASAKPRATDPTGVRKATAKRTPS
ncbi:LysR substrate-binding domain-containing protein [Paraburkholderia silviterrae]|uniref:LysR family transcriptional regulator n=1 Tax=Paraburkholderia silviterrae TaxID=2528715 RepID=A0A4V2ZYY0_9BURK|nr:LysR substrate-binding domain-containing protein [Paraburkholderia silviterrae]TDG22761.1 LysR family transcriptional regulator [Paraburkholderia silviterrae]